MYLSITEYGPVSRFLSDRVGAAWAEVPGYGSYAFDMATSGRAFLMNDGNDRRGHYSTLSRSIDITLFGEWRFAGSCSRREG